MAKSRRPIVNRLRVLRAQRRLSQLDTALSAGIGPTRYWKIENEYIAPTDLEREALSRVFHVPAPGIFPEHRPSAA